VGPDCLFDHVANCGHSWGLCDLACVVLSGGPLQGINDSNLHDTLEHECRGDHCVQM
jgi:hypothetical protein